MEIAIGVSVLVTQNIETDLDIANGKIVDIVLDEREPAVDMSANIFKLR